MLKQLIQRLLDSRTTPSEAVVANRVSNTGTNIATLNTTTSSNGWTTILYEWVAPNDGYIKIFGNIVKLYAPITGGTFALIGTNLHGSFSGLETATSLRGFLPLRKGESVTILDVNKKDIPVTFNSKIGGGALRPKLFKRSCLCLKSLFNSSRKPSLKANMSISLFNAGRVQKVLNRLLQAKKINSLYLHLMDMQFFKLAVMILLQIHGLGWKIKHAKFLILPTQTAHGNGQQFQSKQEIHLSLMWERLVQVAFGLFHLKPQNNLVIGGML